jgi:hypothetical protein
MKNKSLIFVIFLIVFTVILDFAFGKIYESLYFSEESMKNDRLIHSVLGSNEEILIFGSSRALHHYNPKILEDSLGMTAYNVGSGGQNIYFHLALLESTLERYTPKIAILELMYIDFEVTPPQWDTEKLGTLLPFANQSIASRAAVLLRSDQEKWKLVSGIYPFNSMQYNMLRNNFLPYRNHVKGFMPIGRIWNKPIETKEVKTNSIDDSKMLALYSFIETCQRNNIQLFIFVSPHYTELNGESTYTEVSKQLKEKYDISVLNFENDSLFKSHPEYFADPLHLNKAGTEVFTSYVVQSIKQYKPTK